MRNKHIKHKRHKSIDSKIINIKKFINDYCFIFLIKFIILFYLLCGTV